LMADPKIITRTYKVPFQEAVVSRDGMLTASWVELFRMLSDIVQPLGFERVYQIENNQSIAVPFKGLAFNSAAVSQVIVDYLIQRVTIAPGTTVELIQSGTFHLAYRPTSLDWDLVPMGTPGPDVSGVVFTVTADGQINYTSTAITGTPYLSRVGLRARTQAIKSHHYSQLGGRG
jgi:hypothetical protein